MNILINCIKCSRKVKKIEARNLLLATGSDDMFMNSRKNIFCGIEFGKG
jgi:hypothetical protein